MKNLTLENITKVCNGIYHGPQEKLQEEVTAITTDSRKVEKGGLFVPVVGERVDAHRFIPQYFIHWPFPNYHAPGCDVDSRNPDSKPFSVEEFMQYLSQLLLRHRSWAGGFLVVVCSYHMVFHHLIRLKSYFFPVAP